MPYARGAAKYLGVPLDVVQVDSSLMAAGLEEIVWQLDEPFPTQRLECSFHRPLARQHGIKVLLSGAGGDDLFTGYRRHLALRSNVWCWLPRPIRVQLRQLTVSYQLLPPSVGVFEKLSLEHTLMVSPSCTIFVGLTSRSSRSLYTCLLYGFGGISS